MKKSQSIDGFVLRSNSGERPTIDGSPKRRRVYLDGGNITVQLPAKQQPKSKRVVDDAPQLSRATGYHSGAVMGEEVELDQEIASSLSNLPELADRKGRSRAKNLQSTYEPSSKKDKKTKRRKDKIALPKSRRRKLIRRLIIWTVVGGLLAIIGFMVLRALGSVSNIFEGNPLDAFTSTTPLDEDKNGRTNILILGTADDEKGHDGGNLTDSIMIMSIDQDNYDAYMISIPRDLWVDYGQACPSGYKGKINAAYSCFGGATGDVAKDKAALKKSIIFYSNITGIDIQYATNVNYTVFRDVVNAIGGSITVTIESRDPRGILDGAFDGACGTTTAQRIKNCPPNGHALQLPNGEQTLDAEHALYLVLARGNTSPTYGLEQSNFDREKNQQLVIKGIIDKANSNGSFTNVSTVMSLITSMGTNLRTTFETGNIKTLINIVKNFKSEDMQTVSLVDAEPALLTTSMVNGQSVVVPVAGTFNYTAIQKYLAKKLSSDPVASEEPTVYVYNGGAASGSASAITEKLSDKGYTATTKGNVDDVDAKYKLYDLTDGRKSRSAAALKKLFGVEAEKVSDKSTLPTGVDSGADFILVVGSQYVSESSD